MAAAEEKIVVDTNVLISALINPDSIVWEIVEIDEVDFLAPEIVVDEIGEYESLIRDKLGSRGKKEEYDYLLSELFHPIVVVSSSVYEKSVKEAYETMEPIDEKDTEFLALALTYKCPVWSDDGDFQKQERAEVYTTDQIVEKFTTD